MKFVKFSILFFLLFACRKEQIKWDLDRTNQNDFYNPECISYYSITCDTITSNLNVFGYGYNGKINSPFINTKDYIDTKLIHSGKSIMVSGFGGEFNFEDYFKYKTILTFWYFSNNRPLGDIYLDGSKVDYSLLNVDIKKFSWDSMVQIKIDALILEGKHKIEIKMPKSTGADYTFYIDDIEFRTNEKK